MKSLVVAALLAAAPQEPETPATGPLPIWQNNRAVLLAECRAGLSRGRDARALAARSKTSTRRWQRETSARLRRLFAPLPELLGRAAPPVTTVRTVPFDDLRVEHLLIESRPGMHVTAHAYVPSSATTTSPAPGVLIACGHARDGKSSALYQRGAATLARAGFVVLIFDPLDQGERLQSRAAPSRWGTRAHNVSGLQALLVGWNQAGLEAFDGLRCIDALAARDDVDANRLAVCGNSGGGTQSAQLFALDTRLKAAAPSCYLTGFGALLDSVGPQDCEQNLPGQLTRGLDHTDYLAVRAPAPALICAARDDFFPVAGTRQVLAEALPIYLAHDAGDALDISVAHAAHGWHPALIEATTRWFQLHLSPAAENRVACVEKPLLTTPERTQVAPAGGVLALDGERSIFELLRARSDALRELRAATPEVARIEIARDLAGVRPMDDLPPVRLEPAKDLEDPPGGAIELLQVRDLTGMLLPASWTHRRSAQDRTVLAIGVGAWSGGGARSGVGARSGGSPSSEVDPRVHLAETTHQQVFSLDPIALGDARASDPAWYGAFGSLARDAALCRLIDRPLLGLQVEQILAVARDLARPGPRVDLHARGPAALAALHAAAFEPQLFGRIDVESPIHGWEDLMVEEPPLTLLPLVVPGALEGYELGDLRARLQR